MLLPPGFRPEDLRPLPRTPFIGIALALAACSALLGAAPVPYRSHVQHLEGELTIAGSRSMADLVARWTAIFRREHPEVRVTTMLYGSGTAAGAIADGSADLAPLVRALRPGEGALPALRGIPIGSGPQPLYLYLNRGASPAAVEFVRVALSREGQAQIAEGRLSPAARAEALEALAL